MAIVEANPTAMLEEIQAELARWTGLQAHRRTILAALQQAGLERSQGGSGVRVERAAKAAPPYGYTEAHRRLEPEEAYPSCLTDKEWALV